jgi:hypothetical protein
LARDASPSPNMLPTGLPLPSTEMWLPQKPIVGGWLARTKPGKVLRVVRSHISWQRTAGVIDSCAFPDRL